MYIKTELVERILTSEKGKELLANVPPVYSDGYVALWLFQTSGEEMDLAADYVETYELQTSPINATWSLQFWEELLGLPTNPEMTDEQRRAIILANWGHKAMTPKRLEDMVSSITGFSVKVFENTGINKFTLSCEGSVSVDMLARIHREIDDKKPAHLVFDVETATLETASVNYYEGVGISILQLINVEVS